MQKGSGHDLWVTISHACRRKMQMEARIALARLGLGLQLCCGVRVSPDLDILDEADLRRPLLGQGQGNAQVVAGRTILRKLYRR